MRPSSNSTDNQVSPGMPVGILFKTRYISSPGAMGLYSFANSGVTLLMTISKFNVGNFFTGAGAGVGVLTNCGGSDDSDDTDIARVRDTIGVVFFGSGRLAASASASAVWEVSGDLDLDGDFRFRADFRVELGLVGNTWAARRDDVLVFALLDRGVFTGSYAIWSSSSSLVSSTGWGGSCDS